MPHTVSVVVTCYNEGAVVAEAVRSVLAQTHADQIVEVIIADDGSDRETLDVLCELEKTDARLKLIRGRGGNGIAAQRNLAMHECSGTLIAFLDADDLWHPRKLELQLPCFEDARVGLAYTGYYSFAGNDPGQATLATVRDVTGSRDLTREYFLNDPPILPSTTIVKRSDCAAIGGFDAAIRVFEDTDFCIRMSQRCTFAFQPEPLLYKRTRAASITESRSDLLAHHALVALKAAAVHPALLPLVPRRLAERARKLGNYRLMRGDYGSARELLEFAVRLNPFSARIWSSLAAAAFAPQRAQRFMIARARRRLAYEPA